MDKGEYYVRRLKFPNRSVRACVIPNDDGSFDIYLNTLWPESVLAEALEHELRHINGEHFYLESPIEQAEAEAAGKEAAAAVAAGLAEEKSAQSADRRRIPLFGSRDEIMAWLCSGAV